MRVFVAFDVKTVIIIAVVSFLCGVITAWVHLRKR